MTTSCMIYTLTDTHSIYLCFNFLVGFEPNDDARENAHHILIMGCTGMNTKISYR